MSYYGNEQWTAAQPNWDADHSAKPSGVAGPIGPQEDYDDAFFYQFEEIIRAEENLAKSSKGFSMGPRHGGRMNTMQGHRRSLDEHGHYLASPSYYGSGTRPNPDMSQLRKIASARESNLRKFHTNQQALGDQSYAGKMSDLIARQRSALYGEGPKGGYIDETGAVRPGVPSSSGPSRLRRHSPMIYAGGKPSEGDAPPISTAPIEPQQVSPAGTIGDINTISNGTVSPQPSSGMAPNNSVFDGPLPNINRADTSSSADAAAKQDPPAKSKPQTAVAPIGTRLLGSTPTTTSSANRSTTPLSPSNWGRGSGSVWGQSSALGAHQASVWG